MSGWILGLTGGIASGKSAAAECFRRREVPVRDADQVAREVVAPGQPALAQIGECFGPQFLLPSGELDRRALRQTVFADPEARVRLERITHPAIRRSLLEWCNAQSSAYCVIDVAILFESGFHTLVNRSLLIDADPETQLSRLCDRDGIDRPLAQAMMAAQMPRDQRCARADDVLLNAGTLDELDTGIGQAHALYLELASGKRRHATGLRLPMSQA